MSAKDFINVRKALPGVYSNRKESFSLSETEDANTMDLTANTDFRFFELKKGDFIQVKKNEIESELNNHLFTFQREE